MVNMRFHKVRIVLIGFAMSKTIGKTSKFALIGQQMTEIPYHDFEFGLP